MAASNANGASSEELDQKIVDQLEYYFGNINLPRDKFLQEKLKDDEGWVPIDTLLTFNRLKQLCDDKEKIAKAVKEAESEIVSVNEDMSKIRRNIGNPLPENSLEYWQVIKSRTCYMKGFPVDTKLDDIQAFAKKFGNVENVLMRRLKKDKVFKGSCFVTYKTKEEAQNAAKSEDKFTEDGEMIKMMQDEYWVKKNRESKEKRAAEKLVKLAKKNEELVAKKAAKMQAHFVKGLVLAIEGVPSDATVQEIKEFFNKFSKVGYVVHEENATNAEIRFAGDENAAQKAWDKAKGEDNKVIFKEQELTARVLEGEEEAKYWEAFNDKKVNKFKNQGSGGRGGGRGRGRGRGGYHGGRGGPQGKKTVFKDDEQENGGDKESSAAKRPHAESGDEPSVKKGKAEVQAE